MWTWTWIRSRPRPLSGSSSESASSRFALRRSRVPRLRVVEWPSGPHSGKLQLSLQLSRGHRS
eukprot:5107409-Alexandrium_andersonii.AAC.1